MPHRPTCWSLVPLLLATLVLAACGSGQSAPSQQNEAIQSDSMVLHEDRLGPLSLSDGKEINQSMLENTFPNHTVEQKTGTQDGPSYTYYRLGQDGAPVADLRMKTNGSGLERVSVRDSTLSDAYGIHVGTTYAALKNERPDVKNETGYHFHTYAYVEGSSIAYEIDGSFEGPDRQEFEESTIQDWKVTRLIWRQWPSEE